MCRRCGAPSAGRCERCGYVTVAAREAEIRIPLAGARPVNRWPR